MWGGNFNPQGFPGGGWNVNRMNAPFMPQPNSMNSYGPFPPAPSPSPFYNMGPGNFNRPPQPPVPNPAFSPHFAPNPNLTVVTPQRPQNFPNYQTQLPLPPGVMNQADIAYLKPHPENSEQNRSNEDWNRKLPSNSEQNRNDEDWNRKLHSNSEESKQNEDWNRKRSLNFLRNKNRRFSSKSINLKQVEVVDPPSVEVIKAEEKAKSSNLHYLKLKHFGNANKKTKSDINVRKIKYSSSSSTRHKGASTVSSTSVKVPTTNARSKSAKTSLNESNTNKSLKSQDKYSSEKSTSDKYNVRSRHKCHLKYGVKRSHTGSIRNSAIKNTNKAEVIGIKNGNKEKAHLKNKRESLSTKEKENTFSKHKTITKRLQSPKTKEKPLSNSKISSKGKSSSSISKEKINIGSSKAEDESKDLKETKSSAVASEKKSNDIKLKISEKDKEVGNSSESLKKDDELSRENNSSSKDKHSSSNYSKQERIKDSKSLEKENKIMLKGSTLFQEMEFLVLDEDDANSENPSKSSTVNKSTPKTSADRKSAPKTSADRKSTPKTSIDRKGTPKTNVDRKSTSKSSASNSGRRQISKSSSTSTSRYLRNRSSLESRQRLKYSSTARNISKSVSVSRRREDSKLKKPVSSLSHYKDERSDKYSSLSRSQMQSATKQGKKSATVTTNKKLDLPETSTAISSEKTEQLKSQPSADINSNIPKLSSPLETSNKAESKENLDPSKNNLVALNKLLDELKEDIEPIDFAKDEFNETELCDSNSTNITKSEQVISESAGVSSAPKTSRDLLLLNKLLQEMTEELENDANDSSDLESALSKETAHSDNKENQFKDSSNTTKSSKAARDLLLLNKLLTEMTEELDALNDSPEAELDSPEGLHMQDNQVDKKRELKGFWQGYAKNKEKLNRTKISLIGMEYILEVWKVLDVNLLHYHCFLCNKTMSENDLLSHLIDSSHRIPYLIRHFPSYGKIFQPSKLLRFNKAHLSLLDKMCSTLQSSFGRMKVHITTEEYYKEHMGEIQSAIENSNHYPESFENASAFTRSNQKETSKAAVVIKNKSKDTSNSVSKGPACERTNKQYDKVKEKLDSINQSEKKDVAKTKSETKQLDNIQRNREEFIRNKKDLLKLKEMRERERKRLSSSNRDYNYRDHHRSIYPSKKNYKDERYRKEEKSGSRSLRSHDISKPAIKNAKPALGEKRVHESGEHKKTKKRVRFEDIERGKWPYESSDESKSDSDSELEKYSTPKYFHEFLTTTTEKNVLGKKYADPYPASLMQKVISSSSFDKISSADSLYFHKSSLGLSTSSWKYGESSKSQQKIESQDSYLEKNRLSEKGKDIHQQRIFKEFPGSGRSENDSIKYSEQSPDAFSRFSTLHSHVQNIGIKERVPPLSGEGNTSFHEVGSYFTDKQGAKLSNTADSVNIKGSSWKSNFGDQVQTSLKSDSPRGISAGGYQEEWDKFYKKKCAELKLINQNPFNYDFEAEWLKHWKSLKSKRSKTPIDSSIINRMSYISDVKSIGPNVSYQAFNRYNEDYLLSDKTEKSQKFVPSRDVQNSLGRQLQPVSYESTSAKPDLTHISLKAKIMSMITTPTIDSNPQLESHQESISKTTATSAKQGNLSSFKPGNLAPDNSAHIGLISNQFSKNDVHTGVIPSQQSQSKIFPVGINSFPTSIPQFTQPKLSEVSFPPSLGSTKGTFHTTQAAQMPFENLNTSRTNSGASTPSTVPDKNVLIAQRLATVLTKYGMLNITQEQLSTILFHVQQSRIIQESENISEEQIITTLHLFGYI